MQLVKSENSQHDGASKVLLMLRRVDDLTDFKITLLQTHQNEKASTMHSVNSETPQLDAAAKILNC